MLASRRLLEEKPDYKPLLARWEVMTSGLMHSRACSLTIPTNAGCSIIAALVALRAADHLDEYPTTRLIRDWVSMAKKKLVDEKSGLLESSFTCNAGGRPGRLRAVDGGPLPATFDEILRRPIRARPESVGRNHARVRMRARMAGVVGRTADIDSASFQCSTSAPVQAAWRCC